MAHRSAIHFICALAPALLGSAALPVAQQPSNAALTFEAASVQPMAGPEVNGEVSLSQVVATLVGGVKVQDGERVEATTSLRRLIEFAYGVDQRWEASTGSDPLLDEWFHVSARGA